MSASKVPGGSNIVKPRRQIHTTHSQSKVNVAVWKLFFRSKASAKVGFWVYFCIHGRKYSWRLACTRMNWQRLVTKDSCTNKNQTDRYGHKQQTNRGCQAKKGGGHLTLEFGRRPTRTFIDWLRWWWTWQCCWQV